MSSFDSSVASVVHVNPNTLHTMLSDGQELALLDVRENGVYSFGHLFHAVSTPLSHLEMRLGAAVPRRDVRIVLIDDDGQGLVQIAAQRLAGWGYSNLHILEGGMQAWKDAGFLVFSGVYVPSKAFGEFVEHACGTPSVTAETLSKWIQQNKNMIILDSRPYTEYNQFAMPNGICCPGAELPYRIFEVVSDPETTIVINCAGRTRGIIGAQSLINAGVKNPVVVVENGTAGWYLAGNPLAEGQTRFAPPPTSDALLKAKAAAESVAQKYDVKEINVETLAAYRKDGTRSLFVLDVRTPEEYEAGHLVDSRSAPGGQLIQSTDVYVGVRHARIVLVDDNGVRARFTAAWLRQMGWKDVEVMTIGNAALALGYEVGPEPKVLVENLPDNIEWISAAELNQRVTSNACVVVDFANSLVYRDGHIPGARFAMRSRLSEVLRDLPQSQSVVLTSPDGELASWAWAEAVDISGRRIQVLSGGTQAWKAAGLALNADHNLVPEPSDDVWFGPYDYRDLHKSMTDYLKWEIDLLEQINEQESIQFSCEPIFPK